MTKTQFFGRNIGAKVKTPDGCENTVISLWWLYNVTEIDHYPYEFSDCFIIGRRISSMTPEEDLLFKQVAQKETNTNEEVYQNLDDVHNFLFDNGFFPDKYFLPQPGETTAWVVEEKK